MGRKAFLLGCNSEGLKHCETDAQLMDKALVTYNYDRTLLTATEQKAPLWNLLPHLSKFLKSCEIGDTVIFYFAGHSLNHGKGKFNLVLAEDVNDPDNHLKASDLLERLQNHCKAADKLLILDCCEAGKAAIDYDWNQEVGEHFRIFTATSSKATALETDEDTGGGLFTSWIYRALMIEAGKLADADGYLRINELNKHILQRAANYRSPSSRTAPQPHLYGDDTKNITLTDRITAHSNPITGYPPFLITELKSLFSFCKPGAEQLKQCFDACRARSDPAILYPAAYSTGDLNGLLDYLTVLYYQAGNRLPLPLVSFVARLSDMLGNPPDLCTWLEQLTGWLGKQTAITPEHIDNASRDSGPAAVEQTPYLMIEIAPVLGSRTYYIYCYWQDGRGEQQPLNVDDKETVLSDVPQILETTLNTVTGPRPYLEFILPKALMTENEILDHWEQWAPGPPPTDPNDRPNRPLGVEYPLSLRCRERLREHEKPKQCGYDHLKRYWNKYNVCLNKPPVKPSVSWLKADDRRYLFCLHAGALFLSLHFPPQPRYLRDLLDAGAAIVLWPRRKNLSKTLHVLLRRYIGRYALRELPEALREVREIVWADPNGDMVTGGLSLLWDDPNRIPEKADVPLDEIPLEFPS